MALAGLGEEREIEKTKVPSASTCAARASLRLVKGGPVRCVQLSDRMIEFKEKKKKTSEGRRDCGFLTDLTKIMRSKGNGLAQEDNAEEGRRAGIVLQNN